MIGIRVRLFNISISPTVTVRSLNRYDLKRQLVNIKISDYREFEHIFAEVLDKHAPQKKKIVGANKAPYITKKSNNETIRVRKYIL